MTHSQMFFEEKHLKALVAATHGQQRGMKKGVSEIFRGNLRSRDYLGGSCY